MMKDFSGNPHTNLFHAQELVNLTFWRTRILILTSENLLFFEPQNRHILKLISFGNLSSLRNIKRKIEDEQSFILSWKESAVDVNFN